LNSYLPEVESALNEALSRVSDCPPQLMAAMRHGLLAPGKRLRPQLVILAAESAGGNAKDALPAACAVEMVHAYSLIHDDLPSMDDDDMRRGRPTCHKAFGEALAILAGDALLTLAFQTVSEFFPAATAAACCRELSRGAGAAGMVGGQVLDLEWEKCTDGDPKDLERIHGLKTAALLRSCLQIGAWVAQGERPGGPDRQVLDSLDQFGSCFGLLFQITDDLLDVEGDPEKAGKRLAKDAERGKLTYPRLFGVEETRQKAHDLCRRAVAALEPLGEAGRPLAELARSVVTRDH